MNSSVVFIIPPTKPVPRVLIPIVQSLLAAGFPSPADDFAVKRYDLNELLITHPAATFMWRVSGLSMIEAGIFDGDVLVVNRALTPAQKDVVLAQVDSEFTVKYLYKRADCGKLVPANLTYSMFTFRNGQQLIIVGLMTATIKRFHQ